VFHRRAWLRALSVSALVPALLMTSAASGAQVIPTYQFATPVFGLATSPDGSLLVADAGAGIVEFRKGEGSLMAELPFVTDVSPIGRGQMFATTSGGPGNAALYRVSRGRQAKLTDLWAFEAEFNPDNGAGAQPGLEIDSNPFDVEALGGGHALVADAAANDLLIVDNRGNVDWVAVLPVEVVPTANLQALLGCDNVPPELSFFAFICALETLPAQAVATSVAIGPDGAYYMGELKGVPAPRNESRIWRIEAGSRHVRCGTDPGCTLVKDGGFTSIVDLSFGPDGTLYVTELDEASWAAVEFGGAVGGTVNACNITTWSCDVLAPGLTMPIATTVDKDGTVYALTEVLLPTAKVIALP
jgi:hypothetical protein